MQEFNYTGKAMGTDFAIAIVTKFAEVADPISEKIISEIQANEARFSRFLPESELSGLNKQREMIVSKTFIEVASQARELFEKTHGAFNPLFQISRLGYEKSFSEIESAKNTAAEPEEKYDTNFSSTIIDTQNSKIILQEGQKIDFGGFLKGYLAEKLCKEIISDENVRGAIVNIGGDLHVRGLDENGQKFIFKVYNPVIDEESIEIPLFNQSLATSGTYKRKWGPNESPRNHILGISGKENPNSDIISASVIHNSGGVSEAIAKTLISIGPDETQKLFEEELKFIIIKKDGQIINKIK